MIAAQQRREVAARDFQLSTGLLLALVVDRVPFDRLAADYGYPPHRLRARLAAHLAACAAALGPPPAEPAPPPSPEVRIRTRHRLERTL